MRLGVIAGLSGFSVSGVFALVATLAPHRDHPSPGTTVWHTPWLMLAVALPLVAGIATTVWALSQLKRGVKANTWPQAELAALRRRLEHPIWKGLAAAAILLYLVLIVRNSRDAFLIYLMIVPFQTLAYAHRIITPRTAVDGSLNLTMNPAAPVPIRSMHWGQQTEGGRAD